MVVKGQYVKLTLEESYKHSYKENYVYIGKDIIDERLLFVILDESLAFKLIPASAILNAEVFTNSYYDKIVIESGIVDEGSEEKFKHWLSCLAAKEPEAPSSLYNYENRLAFKHFSLEDFKLYFCGDYCKRNMLAHIMKNGLSADNLDKFLGYHGSISRCIRGLNPKSEQELADFIAFTNKQLKTDKRVKGLSSQDNSYFYRLSNALDKGADYNDYPRSRVKPALMKKMWESSYCYKEQVPAFASLLRSNLSVEDIYTLINHVEGTLCELPEDQLKTLLDSYTTVEEALKLLRAIEKHNNLIYKKIYQGELTLDALTKAIEEELESRRPKVDLTKKVDANSLFM